MVATSSDPPGRRCPSCGAQAPALVRWCPSCGSSLHAAPAPDAGGDRRLRRVAGDRPPAEPFDGSAPFGERSAPPLGPLAPVGPVPPVGPRQPVAPQPSPVVPDAGVAVEVGGRRRRDLLVVGVVAAVIALGVLVGQLRGGSGASDGAQPSTTTSAAAASTTSTTEASASSVATPSGTAPAVPPVGTGGAPGAPGATGLPSASAPSTVPTTTTVVTQLGPLLPGSNGRLIGIGGSAGRIIDIDLETGTVTRRELSGRLNGQVMAQPNGFVVAGDDISYVPFDGSPAVRLATNAGLVAAAGSDRIVVAPWTVSTPGDPAPRQVLRFLHVDGSEAAPPLEVPSFGYAMGMLDDHVVVNGTAGGVYVVAQGEAPAKLVDGIALTAGSGRLVYRSCDEHLACTTKIRAGLHGKDTVLTGDAASFDFYGWFGNTISPDGRHLVAAAADGVSVFDTDTGERVGLLSISTGGGGMAPVSWSPDGHFLFFVQESRVIAWSVATGDTVSFPELPEYVSEVVAVPKAGT